MINAKEAQEKLKESLALSKQATENWVVQMMSQLDADIKATIVAGKNSLNKLIIPYNKREVYPFALETEYVHMTALTRAIKALGYIATFANATYKNGGTYNLTVSWSDGRDKDNQ